MAHGAAMDANLAKLGQDRERAAFERARDHKEAACRILNGLGKNAAAETIARRFGQGSNATVDT
jgi:hypothetical protein